MIDDVVFLADQLVGLLFILHHRAAHLCILTLQLFAGKVLDDAGPQRVPQDVGRGPQAVTRGAQGGGKNRKIAAKAFLLIMLKAHLSQNDMTSADVLDCLPALCISNLCGVGAWQPSEALR